MTAFPPLFRLRQHSDAPSIEDVPAEVGAQLVSLGLGQWVRPRQSVAVAVGSRGIVSLAQIVHAIVEHLRRLGADPFLVPAMGSHGDATAEGQRAVLESCGVTEAAAGCPIRSSMETVVLGETADGVPVHFDRLAFEADHVFVLNRVKPHTMFSGPIQSGLLKMLLVGLGKHEGAKVYHEAFGRLGFDRVLQTAAEVVFRRARVLGGVAVVENACERTARIEALRPETFVSREPRLLELAQQWMARLPFDQVDLLLVDRIGKDKSGTGMDSNVIGRKSNDHAAAPDEHPKVKRIAVRGLTRATRGNALGIGMAEFCRSRVPRQMDRRATRRNVLASGHVSAAMLPLDYATDREMLEAALGSLGPIDPAQAKVLWIADTLALGELACSAAYLDEARQRTNLEVLTYPRPMPLDAKGNLPDSVLAWR